MKQQELAAPSQKKKNDTVRAIGKNDIARASGEFETARTSGERAADVRASGPKPENAVKASTRINGPSELAQIWHDFLAEKFSATEMERLRAEFEALPNSEDDKGITRAEFEEAVNNMKNGKAPGADMIPAEVWKNSAVAKEVLFEFVGAVWQKEVVPPNLAVQAKGIPQRLHKIPSDRITQPRI